MREGEKLLSERWVALTNVELEKRGAGEGGAVELCFVCGGMIECGSTFWRKEKTEEGEGKELRMGE